MYCRFVPASFAACSVARPSKVIKKQESRHLNVSDVLFGPTGGLGDRTLYLHLQTRFAVARRDGGDGDLQHDVLAVLLVVGQDNQAIGAYTLVDLVGDAFRFRAHVLLLP
jgi:hypothetical protein